MINQQIDADINSFIKVRRKSTHKYECERRKNFIRFKAMNNNRRISLAYTRCRFFDEIRLNVTHEKCRSFLQSKSGNIFQTADAVDVNEHDTFHFVNTFSLAFTTHLVQRGSHRVTLRYSISSLRSNSRALATCNRKNSGGKVEREKNSRISYSTLFSKVFYEVVKIAWPACVRRALVSRRLGNSLFSCLFSYHSTSMRDRVVKNLKHFSRYSQQCYMGFGVMRTCREGSKSALEHGKVCEVMTTIDDNINMHDDESAHKSYDTHDDKFKHDLRCQRSWKRVFFL